jgi:hypothetical protein
MKKVLAWAVALALVLSSFTMAFAADTGKTSKDFSDADQIHYTEAVDVMVATGIINGFPDGTFGPQKTVTRGQMAKMIACIMNGGEDVGDQYKSGCPFADSKNHWAAGYIAYCASEHIIDGRSADVFDPEATVTGTEVAKMALTSLGYDSKIQGYTGENWATNVLKDAKKNNLFKDLDKSFVPGDPCDRESAAQILFNMLKAPMVEYDNNISVTTGEGTSVTVNSKANKVVAEDELKPDGTAKEGKSGFVELYEEVFDGKLVQNETDADDFGSPGHSWTYDKEEVGSYIDAPSYEFTAEDEGFAAALKAFDKDLAKDLENNKIVIQKTTVNGGAPTQDAVVPGLGDKVKMFESASQPEGKTAYDVVIEQYVAAQIVAVDTDVTEAEKDAGVTAKVDLKANGVTTKGVKNTDIVGFDAATYVKDAVIALAPNMDSKADEDAPEYIASYVMKELANGAVEKTYTEGTTEPVVTAVTIGGKDYDLATAYAPVVATDKLAVKGEFTLYDYNGYALTSVKTAEPESVINYGVLEAKGQDKDRYGKTTDFVKVFTTDAKEEEYNLSSDIKGTVPASADENGLDDEMIAYTLNDDDEINAVNNFTEVTTGEIGTAAKGEKLKTNDVLAVSGKNYKVSQDVVVFWNKAEKKETPAQDGGAATTTQGSEYEILGIADLQKADSIYGQCFIKDKEVVAIMLGAPLEKVVEPDKVLGFVTKTQSFTDGDGNKLTVTALVDGKEVTYTTKAGYTSVTPSVEPVEFVVTDNELTAVNTVTFANSPELVTEFTKPNVGVTTTGTVADIDGTDLNLGSEQTGPNYQPAGDIVYLNNNGTLEISSLNKIKDGSSVVLYQTKADSLTWNIVIWTAPTTTTVTP